MDMALNQFVEELIEILREQEAGAKTHIWQTTSELARGSLAGCWRAKGNEINLTEGIVRSAACQEEMQWV